MRTSARVIITPVALSLFMASPTSMLAQVGSPDFETAQSGRPSCAITTCLFSGPPVLDSPFSAEAVTTWQPPPNSGMSALRASAYYYRDNAGRVRVEQVFVGDDRHPQRIILTPDATSRWAYMLNPAARTASGPVARGLADMMVGGGGHHQFVLPLSMSRFIVFLQLPNSEESLGERPVAGIQATGTRFATQLPSVVAGSGRGERWVSSDPKLVTYSRSEDAQIGIFEYQLTNISRAEPPPELFDVPSDYAVEPQLKFPLRWENPYSPKTWLDGQLVRRR